MTTQITAQVRLVRCPRCLEVLTEPPDIPLYKCGGCSTILKAKNRRNETNHSGVQLQERNLVLKDEQDRISKENEARSPSRDLTPSSGRSSPDEVKTRDQDESGDFSTEQEVKTTDQDESGDFSTEQWEDSSFSHELSSSPEVGSCEDKDLSTEVIEKLQQNEGGKCPSGQNGKKISSVFKDCSIESIACKNVSAEFPSSSEFSCHNDDVLTPEVGEHAESDENNPSNQSPRKNQMERGNSQTKWCEGEEFRDEIQSIPEHDHQKNKLSLDGGEHKEDEESTPFSLENNEKSLLSFRGQNEELIEETDNNGQVSSFTEIASQTNGNSSPLAGEMAEPEKDIETTEIYVNADPGDSAGAAQGLLSENGMLVHLMSPDAEQLENSQREDTRRFGRVISVDTLDGSSPVDPVFKLGVKRSDICKSPTQIYYDGSISSYDGTDDQIPDHVSHHSRRKLKGIDYSTAEMHKRDRLMMTNMRRSDQEMQYQASSSSRVLPGKHYHAMKGSSGHRVDLPETRSHGPSSVNRMRLDKEGASVFPFAPRDFQAGHRIGSPSRNQHNLHQNKQASSSRDRPSYTELDSMDLLRTVCELKDQLDRIQFSKVVENRRFYSGAVEEKLTPSYYHHLARERDRYADSRDPQYPVRYGPLKGWPQRCQDSRMAFSGEAAHFRHQANCSCLRCCPQDWHRSAQLPSHSMFCNNSHCMIHTGHNCCNVLVSGSPTPQQYTSSEHSLLGRETMSDEQRYKEMTRLHLREKYQTMKRHLRPIAGGAPVIACCHCSELLQLPSNFLLFKRRNHQLRCNTCGKVLKFSLLKRMHIVPYLPEISAPPPSEADNYSDAISDRHRVPTSHANSCPHAEPVSCSDDYGLSFCRSCSTEGEAYILTPSADDLERNTYNKKMSSGSSYEPMEDRKMKSILKEYQNERESLMGTSKPAGTSLKISECRKASSEIEELPGPSNSPLHRLMGYSSPSQVLN